VEIDEDGLGKAIFRFLPQPDFTPPLVPSGLLIWNKGASFHDAAFTLKGPSIDAVSTSSC
jgi:hypothetical protein